MDGDGEFPRGEVKGLPFDQPGTFFKGSTPTHSTASDGELEPAFREGRYCVSTGPVIEDVTIVPPDTVEVRCSPVSRIMMVGADGGSKSQEGDGLTEARLTRNWPSPWMRAIVRDEQGRRAWTNAFWY